MITLNSNTINDNQIKAAKPSPRIERGVICWYEGDTFEIDLTVTLLDNTETVIQIPEYAEISFYFKDAQKNVVHACSYTGEDVMDGEVALEFDEDVTKKFRRGRYTYDIRYSWDRLQTIVRDNVIFVE